MEHRHAAPGGWLPQLVFELARLVHRLIDERLDDRLAEWRELTASEAAEEALDPRKPDAFDFGRLLVENLHPRRVEDFAHLLRLTALVVMITENSEHRNCAGFDVLGEDLRLG